MKILILDIGNTNYKLGTIQEIDNDKVLVTNKAEEVVYRINNYKNIKLYIGSTNKQKEELLSSLLNKRIINKTIKIHYFEKEKNCDWLFEEKYQEIGIDLYALIRYFAFKKNITIVNFGTAITITTISVDKKVNIEILPGIEISKLSLINKVKNLKKLYIKKDSETYYAIEGGINHLIKSIIFYTLYENKKKNGEIYVSGGITKRILQVLINDWRAKLISNLSDKVHCFNINDLGEVKIVNNLILKSYLHWYQSLIK